MGVDALLEAGCELLAEPRLADLLSFAGVRPVAARAGVGAGTVTYHFPSGSAGRGPNSELAEAVAGHALSHKGLPIPTDTATILTAEAEHLRNGDESALRRLARAVADDVLRFGEPGAQPSETAYHACLAAAPHDPSAARLLAEFYDGFEPLFTAGFELLAETFGRRFVEPFDARRLTTVMSALADGFLARHRFEPEHADPDLFAETTLRLFQAATTDAADGDDTLVPEEMLRLPPGSPLDRGERHRIVRAARALYAEDRDWSAVTIASTATRAGLSRLTVSAHFPDRGLLSAVVVGQHVPALRDAVERDRPLPLRQILWRHVQRLTELARDHRELSSEYLSARLRAALERGAPDWSDPFDPRATAPLGQLLVRVLYDHADELRPDLTATDAAALGLSSMVTETAMYQALARPDVASSDLADQLVALVLDGTRAAAGGSHRPGGGRAVVATAGDRG